MVKELLRLAEKEPWMLPAEPCGEPTTKEGRCPRSTEIMRGTDSPSKGSWSRSDSSERYKSCSAASSEAFLASFSKFALATRTPRVAACEKNANAMPAQSPSRP
eukprot:scaffold447443_cov32-Prasinocladus_malaysianus.AAC.3